MSYSSLFKLNALLSMAFFENAMQVFNGKRNSDILVGKNDFGSALFSQNQNETEDECLAIASASFSFGEVEDLIIAISSEFISDVGGNLAIRSGNIIRWKKYTENNGEDLFTCAFAASRDRNGNVLSRDFSWPFCLKTDNQRLNQCLANGISENHLHMNGSSPIFYLNWVSLNNASDLGSFFTKNKEKKYSENCDKENVVIFKNYCRIAVRLRRFLFFCALELGHTNDFSKLSSQLTSEINGCSSFISNINESLSKDYGGFFEKKGAFTGSLQSYASLNGVMFDYAENIFGLRRGVSIETGERSLLYWYIYHFHQLTLRVQAAFYLYLVVKLHISRIFFQSNNRYGFKNFSHYEKMSSFFLEKTKYLDMLPYFTAKYIGQNENVVNAELRLAPGIDFKQCKRKLVSSANEINKYKLEAKNNTNFFFVFHFIKEPDNSLNSPSLIIPMRHQKFRLKIAKEAEAIIALSKVGYGCEKMPLLGVDAANSEVACRPEVFGPVFRRIRQYRYLDIKCCERPLRLGYTYHVGEDFVGIVDGLRAIFEAINFLGFREGDRLGHCSVLGTNVGEYYKLKFYEITKTKQNALDDFVWMYITLAKVGYSNVSVLNKLSTDIGHLMIDVFGKAYNIRSYFASMMLRGDDPRLYQSNYQIDYSLLIGEIAKTNSRYSANVLEPDYSLYYSDPDARLLMHNYHYSWEVRHRGEQAISLGITSELQDAIEILQKFVRDLVISRQIAIETNPTSNLLIGPFSYYQDLPIFTFNHYRLSIKNKEEFNIPISVNTDDQGIFRTSLEVEYSIIFELLTSNTDSLDKIPMVDPEEAFSYIQYLCSLSNSLSFFPRFSNRAKGV